MNYLQTELLRATAEAYNQSTNITLAMAVAVSQNFVTPEEVIKISTDLYDSRDNGNEELEKATIERLNEVLQFVVEFEEKNPEKFQELLVTLNKELDDRR
jgi:ABC-type transporter Mla subunit MlaD